MSENTGKSSAPGTIAEVLAKNFERLPDADKKFFMYGPMYLGGNAGLGGMIANSLYRRALNVTQAPIASSLPMTVLPFLTTVAVYNAAVCSPLLSGDLNCPTCAVIRGGLVGLVGAGLYPILLALPVNAGLATRYTTAPMPEKGNLVRFWWELSRPILKRMRAILILQVFFGAFLGSRHHQKYTQLAQMTYSSDGEELKD
ncbi:transmembrane protein 126A [Solea solea]|uniref:transmembrane protein 126A n=1 Tax=Solea solea TaxID=90069 RepID=UPI00272DBF43|nr:transmembrane protein 126A [Solea solea]